MEPARSTGSFSRRITATDSNNIVTIVDLNQVNSKYRIFDQDYLVEIQAVLEDLKITVGLSSLLSAPFPDTNALMSEAQQQAEVARLRSASQKISLGLYTAAGNGPWQYESEVILMNMGAESHVPILVPFLSSNETLLVGGDFKLGVKVEPKWNQPLKVNDYLIIRGTYKQVVSFSKKKDDGLEALSDRLSALESLLSIFGAPSTTLPGSNGLVPAPPTNGSNRLLRADRSWQDTASFVSATNSGLYGSMEVPATSKSGWSGMLFAGGGNKNYLIQNPLNGDIGFYDSAAVRWNFMASNSTATIGLPLSINGTAIIRKILFMQTIISLPSIASQGYHQIDVAFTGVVAGHFVIASPTVNPVTNGFWTFYCHAQVLVANTVSIFFKNDWSGVLDMPDFWIRVMYVES